MIRTVSTLTCTLALFAALVVLPACETDQAGVRSNYRSQYTHVPADTEDATETAAQVLEDLELKDVESRSTAVDGRAIGYTADGTQVTVSITRVDDDNSEVSVNVGTFGDPALGKRIVADIREQLID